MALFALVYALAVYVAFLATFVCAVAFVANLPWLPTGLDRGPAGPVGHALSVDLALLSLFAVQHSVMARRSFKQWWTRWVPAPMERATFVLAASLVLALLLWRWQPITQPLLWSVQAPAWRFALHALQAVGWGVALVSTYLIDHFALFGLRQPWDALRARAEPPPVFRTPLLYRHVRHPLYLGFVLAFWAAPEMTAGHALFAAANTVYILIGIAFEERDLIAQFGTRYVAYRRQVGMLLPRLGARKGAAES